MSKPHGELIQHLGIVAGMCREVELADKIDRLVARSGRTVSIGQAVFEKTGTYYGAGDDHGPLPFNLRLG